MSPSGRADEELAAGSAFGSYRVDGRLGAGGMSVLYEATEVALERTIALKVMAGRLSEDAAFRHRFVAEARAASAVEHPNVIPIYAAGEAEGRLFIAMQLVAGGFDLRKLLRREGPLSVDHTIALMAQASAALDACHARGLVHRDVKPDNLLLSPDDQIEGVPHLYLTDFGLTRAQAVARFTQDGQVLGTLAYAPPEQIRGEDVDGRTDVYSLGITAFECLAGHRPFVRSNDAALLYAQLSAEPPSIRQFRPDLPPDTDRVLRCALAKDRDDRFTSCAAFLTAFGEATGVAVPRLVAARPSADGRTADAGPVAEGEALDPPSRTVDHGTVARPRPATHPIDPPRPPGPVGPVEVVAITPERDRRRGAWLLRVAAGVVALLVIVGLVVVLSHRGGTDDALHLPRLTGANGLTVDRAWRLAGNNGDRFEATTEVANPTDHPVTYTHDEVFPKSLAPTADVVAADPAADRVVVADPVLRWKRDLAAHQTLVLHFTIAVAPDGPSDQRLRAWADDRRHTESVYAKTADARESQTPFEDDDGVEVAAGPGTAVDTAPIEDTTVGTEITPSDQPSVTTTAGGTEPPTVTGPRVTTTAPRTTTKPTTTYVPPTVTTPTTKVPYSPASSPAPSPSEQTVIGDVNSLRAGSVSGLTTDGRLIAAAGNRALANAGTGSLDSTPISNITPSEVVADVVALRGTDVNAAWATVVGSPTRQSTLTDASYQFIGAGVQPGNDGLVYVVIVVMRVR